MEVEKGYTVQEAAAKTGLSAHTLRYYERAGLLAPIQRAGPGEHRRYSDNDLLFLVFLRRMRATGMPIRKLRRYAELAREGDTTAGERRDMLLAHREAVCAQVAELQECLEVIAFKIDNYELLLRPDAPHAKGNKIK